MFEFSNLPMELQLYFMDFVPSRTLVSVLETNKQLNQLALSSLISNINKLTSPENETIYISIFSPQNKNRVIETFNTICVSNPSSQISTQLPTPTYSKAKQNSLVDMTQVSHKLSSLIENLGNPMLFQTSLCKQQNNYNNYNSIFQIGNLQSTRDPLNFDDKEIKIIDSNIISSNFHLIVNKDEPFIKFNIDMKKLNSNEMNSLFKFSSKLPQLENENSSIQGQIFSENNAITIDYILKKGIEIPPRNDYDYDVFYNYEIEFGKIHINNTYFMNCMENFTV